MDVLNRWLGTAVFYLAGTLLAVMTIVVFLQVIYRYFLMAPLSWAEEVARFCFIWVALLGMAIAVKDRAHFSITMLTDRFPARVKSLIKIMVLLVSSWLFLILIREGWSLVQINQMQESPAIGIPMSFPYMAVPLGGLLALVFLWLDVLIRWRNGEEGQGGGNADLMLD